MGSFEALSAWVIFFKPSGPFREGFGTKVRDALLGRELTSKRLQAARLNTPQTGFEAG
jgi:hypothetical protein